MATYCQPKRHPFQHLAVRFAAKEAVFKALGTGLSGGLHWTDAEVRNESSGKPYLILSGPATELADRLGVHTILISLSHSRQHAIAQVMLFGTLTGAGATGQSLLPHDRVLTPVIHGITAARGFHFSHPQDSHRPARGHC